MASTTSISTPPAHISMSPWRSVGIWMSGLLIAYLLFNVFRAVTNPAGFATFFGIPLNNPSDDAFVLVYAIRTLFLSLFGLALLARGHYASLALFLLVATIMPIGDALLVWQRGGEPAIIMRHVLVIGIILLTWFLTNRWERRAAAASA